MGNAKNRHTGVPEKTPRPQLLLLLSTGSSYYDNVRPLAYPDSDAVLICFDISRPETLDSVIKKVSNHFISPHRRQHLNSAASLEDVFVLLISIFVDSAVCTGLSQSSAENPFLGLIKIFDPCTLREMKRPNHQGVFQKNMSCII